MDKEYIEIVMIRGDGSVWVRNTPLTPQPDRIRTKVWDIKKDCLEEVVYDLMEYHIKSGTTYYRDQRLYNREAEKFLDIWLEKNNREKN